ncbi:hypothetical protein K2173_018678 [Erythroxylum novogranatense]|uniref:TATA box binding protein associated factor (TAF) histone-like fold domain-containing protein n=1 Tax=Erythroxylum novogranatense TaxID=1862640 RepID=A0AAV8SB40_9ROSI|nr:hypothetical protein K2173_018678 [Erythroxylum novogranatense]
MSIIEKERIEVIAQSIGIPNLSPDVCLTLAPDVEYRIREIIQDSIKCMRHSRRTTMTTDDVDSALSLRNVEPVYGFASTSPLRFKRAIDYRDLFYLDDKDVDFKDVIEAPLPKAPLDTTVVCHWLAVEGLQPAIPENAPLQVIAPPPDGKSYELKEGFPVDVKFPVKHVLSREFQLYFDKITELAVSKSSSILFKQALVSLATDSGIHPLVPYFTCFIADEVSRGLNDFQLLFALMRIVRSMLQNPHVHIEPYLHQLMPSIVTCLVAKRLGNRFADNHWELRDFTSKLVASICKRFGHVYISLQTRLTKTLVKAFLDPKLSLTQHYGAIQGLTALGTNVVRLLILPNLAPYLQLLEPKMLIDKQKNEMKRFEAWRVYDALLCAAGHCIRDCFKVFPPLLSPPTYAIGKISRRLVTEHPSKRKASMENLEQPQAKKMATDGPVNIMPIDSSPSVVKVESMAPVPPNDPLGTPSEKIQNDGESNHIGEKQKGDDPSIRMSAILKQVRNDELSSGCLLVSLFELFGEAILPFIPAPEMSLFL